MILEPLAQEMDVELVVSEVGNAMLLHKGAINHQYSWVQYDQDLKAVQFITRDGQTQDLGLPIHKPFQEPLLKTRELLMVEVNEDSSLGEPRLIKFSALAE